MHAYRSPLILVILLCGASHGADVPLVERIENGVSIGTSTVYSALRDALPVEKAVSWKKAATPDWISRDSAASVEYAGRIWVMGGRSGTRRNDVWVSDDGQTWDLVTAGAAWSPRQDPVVLSYNGQMWLLGGYDDGGWTNHVYSSTDGVSWTPVTTNASWAARYLHAGTVFNGVMWIMGGDYAAAPYELNDVWYSTNGLNWTLATANAAWPARRQLAAAAFGNVMWVFGGSTDFNAQLNDCWYTSNGVNWFQATGSAAWSPREDHTVVSFDGKLWLVGGYPTTRDVWTSADGSAWVKESTPGFQGLYDHTSLVFDEKIWVINSETPEVWYHDPNSALGCAAETRSGAGSGADWVIMLAAVLLLGARAHRV
jgi:hypothetical protein